MRIVPSTAAAALVLLFTVEAVHPGWGGTESREPASGRIDPASPEEVLLAGLEAYEHSIRALRWEQHSFTPPNSAQDRLSWILLEESDRYIDVSGRWFLRSAILGVDPPDFLTNYDHGLYFGGGSWRVTWGPDENRGMLTNTDDFFFGGAHMFRLMGRVDYDDIRRPRMLFEVLRQSKRLVVLPPTADEPWPGLRAEEPFRRAWADMEVRLDPEHGFAPCRFRVFRRPDGLVAEEGIILKFQRVGDVWLPALGLQAFNSAWQGQDPSRAVPDEKLEYLAATRSLVGLPPELATPGLAEWVARLTQTSLVDAGRSLMMGPLGCFDPDGDMASPQIVVIDRVRLNEAMPTEEMFAAIAADARMFNGATGEITDLAEVRRWFSAIAEISGISGWDGAR